MNSESPHKRKQQIDFHKIKAAVGARLEDTLKQLYPMGKRIGDDFCVGSLAGEEGQSLRICLNGSKMGIWKDFATGDAGGDIISLLAAAHRCTQSEAAKTLADMVGV